MTLINKTVWSLVISIALLLLFVNSTAKAETPLLPPLGGPYKVGTLGLRLLDKGRKESVLNPTISQRELMVRVWYPTSEPARKPPYPYLEQTSAETISKRLNLAKDFQAQVLTHSTGRSPFPRNGSPFPVVMLEHGLGMTPELYTSLGEELASFGFVVVATNHTFTSMITVFPDGRSAIYTPPWPTNVERKEQGAAMGRYVDVWVADVRFVLNEFQRLNRDDKFWRGHLDLQRVGIVGHSYGGTTAGMATKGDDRILAGVNLDGSVYPGMESPINVGKPFMTITTESTSNIHSELTGSPGNRYAVTIKGSNHMSFLDVQLLTTKFGQRNDSSKIDQVMNMLVTTRTIVVEFFSKYLKGGLAPTLDTQPIITRS